MPGAWLTRVAAAQPWPAAPQETSPCVGFAGPPGGGNVDQVRSVPGRPWPRRRCSRPWRR